LVRLPAIPCTLAAIANSTKQPSLVVGGLLFEPAEQRLNPDRLARSSHPSNHTSKWVYKAKSLTLFCTIWHTRHCRAENWIAVFITHVPLHTIFPRKIIFTDRTGPTHVSVKA